MTITVICVPCISLNPVLCIYAMICDDMFVCGCVSPAMLWGNAATNTSEQRSHGELDSMRRGKDRKTVVVQFIEFNSSPHFNHFHIPYRPTFLDAGCSSCRAPPRWASSLFTICSLYSSWFSHLLLAHKLVFVNWPMLFAWVYFFLPLLRCFSFPLRFVGSCASSQCVRWSSSEAVECAGHVEQDWSVFQLPFLDSCGGRLASDFIHTVCLDVTWCSMMCYDVTWCGRIWSDVTWCDRMWF